MARQYIGTLRQIGGGALRVIDKMPENYLYIGWILTLFPNARIIHCRRDERDTALSCWMTNFNALQWTNRPEHIVSRISGYQRLMSHWNETLPGRILELEYERMVSDARQSVQRMLEWIDLPWDDSCLSAHLARRRVRTNMSGVRQPIHVRSVGRWKSYAAYLPLLFDAITVSGSR
jgi:hypothetical protein